MEQMCNNKNREIIALLQEEIDLEKRLIKCKEAIIKKLGSEGGEIPCQTELFVNKRANHEIQLNRVIAKHLKKLGISANLLGYKYIKEGIIMYLEDPKLAENITKDFYPGIAAKFETTPNKVERAIRHAVETSFSRANSDVLEEYFGNIISEEKTKATNSEFVATLVEIIQIELA